MKRSILILLLALASNLSFAQKYFGKTYPSTQRVDEYYDAGDVTKAHLIMGKTDLGIGFRSIEKTQEKIIELAKKKGADGVIFSIEEEVYATTSSGSGSLSKKNEKKATAFNNSTSTDLKQTKVKAIFIKYK
ncbi:hypothetical protein EG349_01115 [Chryseobacterium shandongense]|uniref:DUF4156 domain-containing protein n=1 Tax=Chryseobacterium shandongense TaxID=1493872 RepID=A0AAD1DK34_9FLAO|nr:hypothetical protein [Chryseobacterium shandongense]AZA85487.1 hypothetical protein EG349_01115 [Chryseobacterium shandongense]AZA97594.1 hypothetical protein EG353_19585 [Chryseobacterium shandongense]